MPQSTLSREDHKRILDKFAENPKANRDAVAVELGLSAGTVSKYRRLPLPPEAASALAVPDLEADIRRLLLRRPMSREELADALDLRPSERQRVDKAIEQMQAKASGITLRPDGKYDLLAHLEIGGTSEVTIADRGDGWQCFGFHSDGHECNKNTRRDVRQKLYRIFADEGIKTVYDAGNMLDGEARFNRNDLTVFGMDRQIECWIENHPAYPGMTTYFITGDDHEGWYAQRECINIGAHMQMMAEKSGRADLKYLSNVEHDVALKHGAGESVLRIMHPGGGSSYAYSYTSQKIVESLQGGEKPAILLAGHYHKMDYCTPRNVHVIQTGCTEDQTTFMRKKKIEAHVGGGIVWFKQDEHGAIARLRVEYMQFFDRKYYQRSFE